MQVDSSHAKPGSWLQKESGEILIDSGGRGFDRFRGNIIAADIRTLAIVQTVKIEDQNISLIWYMRRLNVGQARYFFGKKENSWRKKAIVAEGDSAIKGRIRSMLEYYSAYFTRVSEDASYSLWTE